MTANLLRLFAIAASLSLVACETVDDDDDEPSRGYGLDNPPAGQGRYLATRVSETPPPSPVTTTEVTTTTTTTETVDQPVITETPPPSTVTPPPVPPTPTPPVSNVPSYGKPVPGKPGFVYPPGVDAKPENMVDVRDFSPGQKVRDPRTGDIFLVP